MLSKNSQKEKEKVTKIINPIMVKVRIKILTPLLCFKSPKIKQVYIIIINKISKPAATNSTNDNLPVTMDINNLMISKEIRILSSIVEGC